MLVQLVRFTRPAAIKLAIPAVALVVLAAPRPASGAALSLDPGFGTGGVTGQLLPTGQPRFGSVTATVTQADGKVLLAGRAYGSPASSFQRGTIIRLNENGTLDASFGEGGRVFLPDAFNCANCNQAALEAIAIDSAGRIILAGQGEVAGVISATAVRLTPLGALDKDFGGTGMVRLGGAESNGLGIATDEQDGVLIATASGFFHETDPSVTRLTPAGVVDAGFGGGGSVSLAKGGALPAAVTPTDLAGLPGGFAVIGTTQERTHVTPGSETSTRGAAVVRVGSGGAVSAFTRIRPAGDPKAEGSFYPDAFATAGGATAAGTVYLAGLSELRLDSSGGGTENDETAPGTGIFMAAVSSGGSAAVAFIPASTGVPRFPVGIAADGEDGFAMLATVNSKYEVVGFDATPALDPDYGQGGVLPFPGFGQPASDEAGALDFDSQRRLVVSGSSANGGGTGKDFGALRLASSTAPPEEKVGGETGGGGSATAPPTGPVGPPISAPHKSQLKCRKGFKKRTVKGKTKCVKPKKHHKKARGAS